MMTRNQIATTNKPGLHGTSTRTLYLSVAAGGSKSWVQRITIAGKRRHMGLGSVRAVSFANASKAATLNLAATYQGGDPVAERREARRQAAIPTFAEAMAITFDTLRSRWGSDKTASKWRQLLANYAGSLMAKRVDAITPHDVLTVLLPAYKTAPDSARRTRQNIRSVLAHCEARGWITRNVAGDAIEGALPKITKRADRHHDAIPHAAIGGAFDALVGHANIAAGLLLRFIVLTAVRGIEARAATWSEIDLASAVWTIPAGRMKTGREHRVPLSPAALDILTEAQAISDGSGLVFPSPHRHGGIVSGGLLRKMLRGSTAEPCTVHGLRSTFRDWCADTGKAREVAEAALAHVVGGSEGAYFRSSMFDRRRRLMESWAAHVTGQRGAVVELRKHG